MTNGNPLTQAVAATNLPRELKAVLLYFAALAQPGVDENGKVGTFFFGDLVGAAARFFSVPRANIEERKLRFENGSATSPLLLEPATASRHGWAPEPAWRVSVR